MKKFFISVGLAAAGTASLQATYAPDLGAMQTTKFWSVSGTLRGFYDDNYTTSPNGQKQGSGGFEVSPSVSFDVPLQQTELGLRYTYGMYYYQDRQNNGNDPVDQTHQVDLWVDHAFSERWQATVKDTLAVGQEPSLLNDQAQPYRVNGNNVVNNGNVALTTDWTRLFSTVLSYNNGYYYYENSGGNNLPPYLNPSQNGLLTRDDQTLGLDLQWAVAPETTALIGYNFDFVDYWGDEPISYQPGNPLLPVYSNSRNTQSHIAYIGAQHSFMANLQVSAKVGVEDTAYVNSSDPNYVTPYAVTTASYTYAPGSYVQLGVSHLQNATYVIAPNNLGNITQNQQSTIISASVNHQITAKLMGSIIGNAMLSTFNQGAYNNQGEQFYTAGVNLTYSFNQHLSTEVGYNFDDLQSNVPGNGYSRNRVYVGLTAAY